MTGRTGVDDLRSEHVGISNEKTGEIPVHRKPKGSVRSDHPLRVSRYSKPRPIGVGDEKQAKYSCTTAKRLSEGVTQKGMFMQRMDVALSTKMDRVGKSARSLPSKCYGRLYCNRARR